MMLHWLALALSSLIGLSSCECNFGYIPMNASTRHVKSTETSNWESMAHQCRIQFPGHDLVARHFRELTDADKAMCEGALVPLGVVKIGDGVVFPGGYGLKADPVDDSTLNSMVPADPADSNDAATVAALNLTTNKWILVDNNHPFTCALCQRAHRADLNASVIPGPAPRLKRVYFAITEHYSSNVSEKIPPEDLLELVSKRLNVRLTDILVDRTGYNSRNHSEFILRIRSLYNYEINDLNSYVLSEDYRFNDFYDASSCTYSFEEGLVWLYNNQGTVVIQKLADNVVATRECTFQRRLDGDWDGAWDAVVFWDFSRQQQCYLDEIKAVAKDVSDIAAKPTFKFDLGTMFQTLIDRVDPLNYVNTSELAIVRHNIFESVSAVVANYIRTPSFETQIANHYFADVMLSNLRDADPKIGFTMGIVRNKLKGNFSALAKSRLETQKDEMNVVLSESLYSKKAGLALAVVKDYQKDLFPLPIKKLEEFSGYYMSNGVVMVMSFDKDDQVHLDEDYYLEVTMRNLHDNNETAKYLQNFAVWAVDRDENSTETCLLVDTSEAATYKCRKMVRDASAKSIHGRYAACRGYTYDEILYDTLEAAKLINRYASIPVDGVILNAIRDIVNYLAGLKFGNEEKAFLSRSTMIGGLREILAQADLGGTGTTLATSDRRVAFLIDDLKQKTPMVGFAKNKSVAGEGTVTVVPIVDAGKALSRTSEVDVVLSPALVSAYNRLAFSVFDDYDDLFPDDSLAGQVYRRVSTVHIVLASDTPRKYDVEDELYYFEIYLNTSAVDSAGQSASGRRRRCVLWDPEGGDNNRWSTSACYKLKATRGSKQVFRCNAFHYGTTQTEQPTADGVYFTFEVSEFNDFLVENVILLVWLVAEIIISLTSLLSIFLTAILIRKWREDIGHQILLHMTMALAINILFGFVNNFLQVDTESASCIAIGIIRHYSYMAMFFWMFVLSALQLKRLLSVLGARSTPNLQLKVAAFAWGMPLIIIVVLFLSVQDAYRSVVKDRGFCYPEGLGFEIFVQGPAGLILVLNVLIFVVILARIYACFGWGELANLQRHANVRTVQLRRLRTAFFVFFLFGLSWAFHFLAEEGVIRNKFIFEYLFLMTACLHVFMLALFFIYLDEGTREEWKTILEDLALFRTIREWRGK